MSAPMIQDVLSEGDASVIASIMHNVVIEENVSHSGMMMLSGIAWAMKKVHGHIVDARVACDCENGDLMIKSVTLTYHMFDLTFRELKRLIERDGYATLTGTDMHDINNASTALFGNLELMCNPIFGDLKLITRDTLCVIEACAKTILQIIHVRMGLRDVICENATLDDLVHVAVEIAKNSRAKWMNIVHFYVDVDQTCGHLNITKNASVITRVLMNVVCNALDATCVDRDQSMIFVNVAQCDDKILIDVVDNGTGIPTEIIEKVFDERFSTKGSCGSGLGLHYCKRAIEKKCAGSISIENNGKGTTVHVAFPLSVLCA